MRLQVATPNQSDQTWINNSVEWANPLTQEQYVQREKLLGECEFGINQLLETRVGVASQIT